MGYKYINGGLLVGRGEHVRNAAFDAAKKNGAMVITKEQADAVSNVDTSLLNVQQLRRDIEGILPKDAQGRITAGPGNKLRSFFQTDDDLAAWGANRNRAIQILRAAAGSHGLRINEAEILYSVANDIPRITDTYDTAMKKLARVQEQLENVQRVILVKDRANFMKQERERRARTSADVNAEADAVLREVK